MSNDVNPYRELPSVDVLRALIVASEAGPSSDLATRLARRVLAETRQAIDAGGRPSRAEIERAALNAASALARSRLEPVINATGVLLHTNLGRSPVSRATAAAMADAAAGYTSLEIDPVTGERGGRMDEISLLMRLLTGAAETLVVNNNASAVLLTLAAIAGGRSVLVSRGEAVEIGGGFRVPDVLRQSGARLVDVGTTNRTYAGDYAAAIDDETTAAILKVHPSNFAITGFTAEPVVRELVEVGRSRHIPVIHDLGSGALLDTSAFGLAVEPTIEGSIAAGVAVVTASGDKLLGGPQAGIIAGERELIRRIAAHPLARAVRADKTCLAGLAATLRHYARGEAEREIPVWRMIGAPAEAIDKRASAIAGGLRGPGVMAEVVASVATVGGGSLPGSTLPSFAVRAGVADHDAVTVVRAARLGKPRVFGRIEDERALFDLRTVLPDDDERLATALRAAINGLPRTTE